MNVDFYLRPETYGIAVLSVAMALLVMTLLNPLADMTITPFLLFFGSIVIAAWWGSAASGILATGLSALVSTYFFMAPEYSLNLDPPTMIRVIVFVVQGIVVSLLCGSLRGTRYRLEHSSLQLQESEFSLRHANQWVTAILESITDGFYAVDLQWRFVYINPQAQHLLNRSLEGLLGQSIWEVMPNLAGSAMGKSFQRAMTTRQPLVVETPGVAHPDRLFEMHLNPLANGLAIYFRDVTDRRNSQRQLYQQMQMLDLANDSIIIQDLDTAAISYWNQGATRRYGWSAAEAIGQSTTELLKTVLPEPRSAIREAILQEGYWVGELTQTTRDGRSIITNSRWTLQSTPADQPDAVLEISSDITEQKQVEADLRKSELHFRTLANSMPQMFWTALPDGQLEYCNQRWYDYTGLTPTQSFAEGWLTGLHPDDRDRCQTIWDETLQKGLPLTLETRPRRVADDQYRWHLVRAFPLRDERGEVLRWFGSLTDIHDQKMALVERDRALDQERVAREEAEAANRVKDEFLAMLSHELRTPLNPILGWVSLLRSRPLDETTRTRALETIERNAKVQAELIEDLLDVSRILRGKLQLNIQSVMLSNVVQAALETVQLAARAKAITLITKFDPDLGKIAGDHNRLQQIVWNLISNAIKFTPKGGAVTIGLRQDGSYAIIEVADNGHGISADFLPHVFEQFRQADSSSTRAFGGLGLGLAIVRYLTEQHGGEVSVTSPGLGQGSTFTVRLQRATTDSLSPAIAPPSVISFTDRRVLVIDDDLDSLHLLTALLEGYGMEVLTGESAEEGLHLIEQHHPDLLISDIGMPEKDGIMLIQTLRQWPAAQGGDIPAIALTAYVDAQTRDRAIAAGFQRHLSKPLDLDQLDQALTELLCGSG